MKIIDILNKKANGTLEDGFKFCYEDEVYTYDKKLDRIYKGDNILNRQLGEKYKLENCLNDDVLLFKQETKEDSNEIEEIKTEHSTTFVETEIINKTNELVKAVNSLLKEREEK